MESRISSFRNYFLENPLTVIACIILISLPVLIFSRLSDLSETKYVNEEYGFSVSLPETWKGYSVTMDKWTGNATGDQLGDVAFIDGPVISIHNPKWTAVNSYQDIPIMVFTLEQWNQLSQEKFHIGAAPINPSELGRNSRYVFALPARYNYSFPPGYEEVDAIIRSKPLKTF